MKNIRKLKEILEFVVDKRANYHSGIEKINAIIAALSSIYSGQIMISSTHQLDSKR